MSSNSISGSEEDGNECFGCARGLDIIKDREAHMDDGGCLYGDDLDDEEDEFEHSSSEDEAEDDDDEDEDDEKGSSDEEDEKIPAFGGVEVSLKKRSRANSLQNEDKSKTKRGKASLLDGDKSSSSFSEEEEIGFLRIGEEDGSSSSFSSDEDIGLIDF